MKLQLDIDSTWELNNIVTNQVYFLFIHDFRYIYNQYVSLFTPKYRKNTPKHVFIIIIQCIFNSYR